MSAQPKPHPPRAPIDVYLFDPMRKPAWRFQVTLRILADHPRSMPADVIADDPIRKLYKFVRRYRTLDSATRPQLRVMFPGLYDAFQIFEASDRSLRLLVECRILAGQTDEEIAAKLQLVPEVVSTYEQMFFHVRHALEAESWILNQVLHPALEGKLSEHEYLFKKFAYYRGPHVLERLLARSHDAKRRPTTLDEIEECLAKDSVNGFWYMALLVVGLERLPFDERTILRLAQLSHRMRLEEKNWAEDSLAANLKLAENARAFMAGFKDPNKKPEGTQE